MGAPTPSMPQNPTNPPMQQSHMGGKGAGKGGSMGSLSQNTPQASAIDQVPVSANQQGLNDLGQQASIQEVRHPYLTMFSGQQSASQPQASGGKGVAGSNPNQLTSDGGNMTLSSTSGQAQVGQPNPYPNTTGSWDNSSIQRPPTMPQMGGGKGKGA